MVCSSLESMIVQTEHNKCNNDENSFDDNETDEFAAKDKENDIQNYE